MSSVARNINTIPSASQLTEFDWVVRILMGIFLIFSPISVFLPPIGGVNPIRFLAAFITLLALGSVFFPVVRNTLRIWFLYALSFIFMLTVLSTDDLTLAVNIKNTFNIIMFFVFMVLLVRKKCENIIWWYYVIIIATIIAFLMSVGVKTGIIGVPSYRLIITELFGLDRTASIVDSSIGIWGLIASLYLVAEYRGWRRKLGYVGIVSSLGAVSLGQFRSYLICCVLILMVAIWFKSLRRIRLPLIGLAAISSLFMVVDPTMIMESSLWDRLSQMTESPTGALRWRGWEREYEAKLITEKPFAGHGWRVAEEHEIGSRGLGTMPIHGHCLYTALPVRVGVPLAAMFILPNFLLLLIAFKYSRRAKTQSIKNLYLASVLSIGSLLIVSFVQDMSRMTSAFPVYALFLWPLFRPVSEMPNARRISNRVGSWRFSTSRHNPRNNPST